MKAAAFFDLDKTIIAKSSVLAFGKPFYREGLLSKRAIVKSMYAQIVYMLVGADEEKMEEVREAMLSLTKGWQQDHVAAIVAETLDDVISPIVFAEALELFDEHHAAGREVVIVSSSPIEVVRPLGAYLGADEVIATRARIDEDGAYSGELEFYAYGEHKETAMREYAEAEGVDLAASFAYSDSITDVPMLSCVGHPVAVNPDKDLATEAAERGWEVRRFARPVRLRDRVHAPPKGATITAGTMVAVGAAAVGVYAWWRRHGAQS
jgi:HAD superfamily hydrolase (TIGR01490 family)